MSEWEIPDDAAAQLSSLSEIDLHLFLRSLPWESYLSSHLNGSTVEALLRLASELRKISSPEFLVILPPIVGSPSKDDLVSTISLFYKQLDQSPRGLNSVIDDVRRTCSARADAISGSLDVGSALDPLFIREQSLATLRQVGIVLDQLGLRCEEVLTYTGDAHRFYTPKIRRADIVRRLISLWEASFPVTSAAGFVGRFYDKPRGDIIAALIENVSIEDLDELESVHLRAIAQLLSTEEPFSPSSSAARRFLVHLINEGSPALQAQEAASDPAVDLAQLRLEPLLISAAPQRATGRIASKPVPIPIDGRL